MIRTSGRTPKLVSKFILFLGVLGAVFVPIVGIPYFNPEAYKKMQYEGRKNMRREDIQPGNMNIWRDPFNPNPTKNMNIWRDPFNPNPTKSEENK